MSRSTSSAPTSALPPAYGWLNPVQVFTGFSGTDWRYGGIGLQIVNPTTIRLFASEKDPGGNTSEYSIDVHVWTTRK